MSIRLCKISLVAASAFFLLLVVFNNITDYGSNYLFVENVLNMSTTFDGNSGMWRAIDAPLIHHLFYISIIAWETISCILLILGTRALWVARNADKTSFEKSKKLAILGLTSSLLQWYIAFLSVGAEWFLMWQSEVWNGQDAAARMFLVMGISLLFLNSKETD